MADSLPPPSDDLDTHLLHFGTRILRDAFNEATAAYWERRALTFEDARPRAGDYRGRATDVSLAAADRRCREAADACRHNAAVARGAVA